MSFDDPTSGTPGAPTQPPSWRPTPDVLVAAPEDDRPHRAHWGLIAGVGALVLALVGGVTYALGALSGGGEQPADALPSGAFAVVSVDLDPSLGQKLDGFRFLRKFPALRAKVPLDGDVREVVFDAVADEAGWQDVDFDADVAPWLGKRLALAAYPPSTGGSADAGPTAVVALQVTDRDKAQAGLTRLVSGTGSAGSGQLPVSWAFSGDYALLAETEGVASDLAKRAESGSLAEDDGYATDLAAVDDGVASVWVDMAAAGRALGAESMLDPQLGLLGTAAGASGRSTMVARFDGPDVFEIVGRASGTKTAGWATHAATGLGDLPESSVVALALADGDALVPKAWDSMRESFGAQGGDLDAMAGAAQEELGITLPDDLATLLGDNLVAALDGERSAGIDVGARVTTDVPAAQAVLDKLEAAARRSGADLPVVRREAGGDLVVASSDAQAERLAADGNLGEQEAFQRALPDLDGADAALWVDPAGVMQLLFGSDGGVDENLEPIDGIGATLSSSDGDDVATYRFRLVAH